MADDDTAPPAPPAPVDRGMRPRSMAWVAVSALAATLILALVLVARSGDDRPIRTVAADRPDTTTTVSSTTEAHTTSALPPTTTTARTAIKTAEPTTSAPTTTAPVPSCQDSDIAVTVETDKPVYATGEEVRITVLATNTSGHDCPPARGASLRIMSADGTVVYDLPGAIASWPPGARWPAGETWRDDPHRWDQRCDRGSCDGVQQPPGEYTIEASWVSYGSARTTIRIG